MPTRIVINNGWGGFTIPQEICREIGIDPDDEYDIDRTDLRLIKALINRGALECTSQGYPKGVKTATGTLVIVEVPDNIDWYISEYDGQETICQKRLFPVKYLTEKNIGE